MIRLRTKTIAEDDQPRVIETKGWLAAEAVLDTEQGFKITVYLDSNGDFTIQMIGDPVIGRMDKASSGFLSGKWRK